MGRIVPGGDPFVVVQSQQRRPAEFAEITAERLSVVLKCAFCRAGINCLRPSVDPARVYIAPSIVILILMRRARARSSPSPREKA